MFARLREVEDETGLDLAGTLVIVGAAADAPTPPICIEEFVELLNEHLATIPYDCWLIGWGARKKRDLSDEEVERWARERFSISVAIGDADVLEQLDRMREELLHARH
jgi:hypothetical protein